MLIELGDEGKRLSAVHSTAQVLVLIGFLLVDPSSQATHPCMSPGLVQKLSSPGTIPTGILKRAPIIHNNLLLHHSCVLFLLMLQVILVNVQLPQSSLSRVC